MRKIEAKEEDSPTFITIMSLPLPVLWFYFQFGLTVFQGHILTLPQTVRVSTRPEGLQQLGNVSWLS